MIFESALCKIIATSTTSGLSRLLTEISTVPSSGSFVQCCLLCFYKTLRRKDLDNPSTSPVDTHLRLRAKRVSFREHIEREYRFFYSVVRNILLFNVPEPVKVFLSVHLSQCRWQAEPCRDIVHTFDTSGTVLDRTRVPPPIRHFSVFDRILHVHKTFHMHLFCDFSRIFFDRLYIFFRKYVWTG